MSKEVEVEITGREASLILKYGCPFPDQAPLFKSIAGKKGFHRIVVGEYWLELIIGDLSRSMKEIRSFPLQEELNNICDSFEMAFKK